VDTALKLSLNHEKFEEDKKKIIEENNVI